MFVKGDELNLKNIECLIEILGVYPSGQGGNKEAKYEVILEGKSFILDETLLNILFYKKDTQRFFIEIPKEKLNEEVFSKSLDELVDAEENPTSTEMEKRRGRPPKIKD